MPEPVTEVSICALLAEYYGVYVRDLEPLPGEYDTNCLVTSKTGRRFIVKIMHSSRDASLLRLQICLLDHIKKHAPDLPVPRIVPCARGGESFALLPAGAAGVAPRFLWLLEYIAGRPYALTRPHSPSLIESLGSALGAMHVALSGFTHAAAARGDFKWDLSRASWIEAYVDALPADRRSLVDHALRAFHARVEPAAAAGLLRRAVLHGDANDYNVLVGAGRAREPTVTGLLDFGDAHEGWVVADVAVAAAYAVMGHAAPLDALSALTAGFTAHFPLCEAEADALLPLVLARLAVSVVNSALRKVLCPDDPYIVVSERPAWAALELLAAVPLDFAAVKLRSAARLSPPAALASTRLAEAAAGDPPPVSALYPLAVADMRCTFGEGSLFEDDAVDDFAWDRIDYVCLPDAPTTGGDDSTHPACIAHFGSLRPQHAPAPDAPLEGLIGCEPAAMLLATALCVPAGSPVVVPRVARVRACSGGAVLLEHGSGTLTCWRGLHLAPSVTVDASLPAGALLGTTRSGSALVVQASTAPTTVLVVSNHPLALAGACQRCRARPRLSRVGPSKRRPCVGCIRSRRQRIRWPSVPPSWRVDASHAR